MRFARPAFLSFLDSNTTIVTGNSLTTSVIWQQIASERLFRGDFVWELPIVQNIDSWLASRWEEARYQSGDIPVLLSHLQESVIWRSIIEADIPDLLDREAMVRLVQRAASIVEEWDIPLDTPEWDENEDTSKFRYWLKQFNNRCADQRVISRNSLWRLLSEWIADGTCRPKKILFAGFYFQTTAFTKLLGSLGERGSVMESNAVTTDESFDAILCEDFSQEIEQAARWARASFESNPENSIGLFVPDLQTHRGQVERIFKQVFYPGLALGFDKLPDTGSSVFHLTAASPLSTHPIVASALLLLQTGQRRWRVADAGAVLTCPFLAGSAAEAGLRALADMALRERRETEVILSQVQRVSQDCPRLAGVWEKVVSLQTLCPAIQDLPSWCEYFGDVLKAFGWPGDGELSSFEGEVLVAWDKALSSLGSLGLVTGVISFDGAIAHLRNILATSGVAVGSWASPIQILDASDAVGLRFDDAFAIGVSEETWPPARSTASLVPLRLQQASGVPYSSPQSIQAEQERLTTGLFATAPKIVVSYSGRISPIVRPYVAEGHESPEQWNGKLVRQSFRAVDLDEFVDAAALPFQRRIRMRGGTGIIKSQSLCPFRAFAEYRLKANTPDEACFGFHPLERGGFLHKALELAWRRLKTQDRLLSLDHSALRTLADEVVSEAVASPGGDVFHQQATQVERERMAELLLGWLSNVESKRTQPFTVESLEQERLYETGGLELRLRVDRIDRLRNGKLALIDYKSGKTSRQDLLGLRPEEPQLLIYAAALGREVEGVFFGQLKPRELSMIGYSREQHLPGKAMGVLRGDKWDEFLEDARENVERIAREFVQGQVRVDPVKGACTFCGMKPLCRVSETEQAAVGEQLDP